MFDTGAEPGSGAARPLSVPARASMLRKRPGVGGGLGEG